MAWWGYLVMVAVAIAGAYVFWRSRRGSPVDPEAMKAVNDAIAQKVATVDKETHDKIATAQRDGDADMKTIELEHSKKIQTILKERDNALDTLRTDPGALDSKLDELLGRKT